MFTGLVEEVGTVEFTEPDEGGRRLVVSAALVATDVSPGASVNLNGCCQTVVAAGEGQFTVIAVPETLRVTTLGSLVEGHLVNLERPVRMMDRLGGHLVQGHVDGVGTVALVGEREGARLLDLAVPDAVASISIPLGSITVDGVSLTVNAIPEPGRIQVALVPFTLQHTTLSDRRAGDPVHLEGDTIGKYVKALIRP